MSKRPYNNEFVYDETNDIYIARNGLLNDSRTKQAADKAGLELMIMGKFVLSPNNCEELDRLLSHLNDHIPIELRKRKSRILTLTEYDDIMSWANYHDKDLVKSSWKNYEVLDANKELGKDIGYVVNAYGYPAERQDIMRLDDYFKTL